MARLGLILAFVLCAPGAWAERITVFAAASLSDALRDAAAVYEARSGDEVVLVFAGSASLARQIQYGAPADLFLSANVAWMDHLQAQGRVIPGSRVALWGNRLVLVGAKERADIDLTTPGSLRAALGGGYLAMALPQAVPAGIYGAAALAHFGQWQDVQGQIAQTDNVRGALALVATQEAALGIVYATDLAAAPGLRALAAFPPGSHPPIRYPMAQITPAGAGFAAFLRGVEAGAILARHGFLPQED